MLSSTNCAHHHQKIVRAAIVKQTLPYFLETRIRTKIERWKFSEPAGWVARRLAANFQILSQRVPPTVISSYLRALWNGVPTSRRMASCASFAHRSCVFECDFRADDSLEHYCRCRILSRAVRKIQGACQLSSLPDGIDLFFGCVKGQSIEDRILCARLVYVRSRLIHFARRNGSDNDWDFLADVEFSRTKQGRKTGKQASERTSLSDGLGELRGASPSNTAQHQGASIRFSSGGALMTGQNWNS
eukprot:7290200-Karenia_brevis.AAC.1